MFPQKHAVAVNNNDDNNNNNNNDNNNNNNDNNNNDNNNNDNNNNNNNNNDNNNNDNTKFSGVQELALLVHCLLVELLFGFCGGRKTGGLGEKSSEQERTQPSCDDRFACFATF